jgi:hypothetical protein
MAPDAKRHKTSTSFLSAAQSANPGNGPSNTPTGNPFTFTPSAPSTNVFNLPIRNIFTNPRPSPILKHRAARTTTPSPAPSGNGFGNGFTTPSSVPNQIPNIFTNPQPSPAPVPAPIPNILAKPPSAPTTNFSTLKREKATKPTTRRPSPPPASSDLPDADDDDDDGSTTEEEDDTAMIEAYLANRTSEPPQTGFGDGHLLKHMDVDLSLSGRPDSDFFPVGDGTYCSFDGGLYVMVNDSYVPILPKFEWTPENLAKVNAGTKRKAEDEDVDVDEDVRKFGVGLNTSFGYNDGDDEGDAMDTGVGSRRKKAMPKRRRDLGIKYPTTGLAAEAAEPFAFRAGGNGYGPTRMDASASSRPDALFPSRNSSRPNPWNLRTDENGSHDALMRSFDSNSSVGG